MLWSRGSRAWVLCLQYPCYDTYNMWEWLNAVGHVWVQTSQSAFRPLIRANPVRGEWNACFLTTILMVTIGGGCTVLSTIIKGIPWELSYRLILCDMFIIRLISLYSTTVLPCSSHSVGSFADCDYLSKWNFHVRFWLLNNISTLLLFCNTNVFFFLKLFKMLFKFRGIFKSVKLISQRKRVMLYGNFLVGIQSWKVKTKLEFVRKVKME